MGIVNRSPDSFAGDGLTSAAAAIEHGLRQVEAGADLLDVGGESTRPGAPAVEPARQLERIMPVVEALAGQAGVPVSVDTSSAVVARQALTAGAWLINDVSGLMGDAEMAGVVAAAGAGVVVMANHRLPPHPLSPSPGRGEGKLVAGTHARWEQSLRRAGQAGLAPERIVLDPGLGFGLAPAASLALLRHLPRLRRPGHALLVGPSRKGFIGAALGGLPVEERLEGTLAAVTLAIAGGADAVRVHDVRAVDRVRRLADAVCRPRGDSPPSLLERE